MTWARTGRVRRTHSASAAKTNRPPRTALMLWRIDQPEVLEHEAALLGSESGQLFPGGIAELRTGARGPGGEHARQMDAVADGRAAHPLFLIVRLGAREGAARVEQPPVQPALALDRLAVEPAGLELAGELARLLGEGPRGGASAGGLQALELLGQRALAGRERAQLLEHGLTAQAHQRQQSLRLPVQPALRFGEARELLHRLGEPRARARARDLATAPRQRQRRGVQGVDRLARERGGGRGVGLSLLQLLARRRHLALREAERALELRRDERVSAGGLADVTLHHCRPLLDRRLARPRGGAALPALQRLGDLLLPPGERRRLRQGLIERSQRFPAPRASPATAAPAACPIARWARRAASWDLASGCASGAASAARARSCAAWAIPRPSESARAASARSPRAAAVSARGA